MDADALWWLHQNSPFLDSVNRGKLEFDLEMIYPGGMEDFLLVALFKFLCKSYAQGFREIF